MSLRKLKPKRGSEPHAEKSDSIQIKILLAIAGMVIVTVTLAAFKILWPNHNSEADVQQGKPDQEAKTANDSMSELETLPHLSSQQRPNVDDARLDGWDTEVFSEQAKRQLKKLTQLLDDWENVDGRIAPLVTEAFACRPLRPENLVSVYDDGPLQVDRADENNSSSPTSRPVYHSSIGFVKALNQLISPLRGSADVQSTFKVFRVTPSADHVVTHQFFAISGQHDDGATEVHAKWIIRWSKANGHELPRLESIDVQDFEQVRRQTAATLFSDCTESVLSGNRCYREQFLHGFNYWLARSQDYRFNFLLGNPGISMGDVNGDGLDDLYVCQEAGLPNRLFLQKPDGTAHDVSEQAGVNWLENSKCALLTDLDNDGDQDLAVAINGGVVLAANDGRANFEIRTVLDSSDDVLSLTAADYNHDGKLDLYIGVYHRGAQPDGSREAAIAAASTGVVYHDANSGGANSLFRNDTVDAADWQFTEVTRQTGLDENNRRFTLAASWEDFDNDGDQDLYVANDFGRNSLYRNDVAQDGERRFVDVAASAQSEDAASGMSVSWGDYDRDGWMDIYVGNMFSAAGNRITFQERFKPEATKNVKARLQRFARGNTLLRNSETGIFTDAGNAAGVTMGRWAWSSNFVDLNNDGWEDLVVANGYMTTDDPGDL